MERYRLLLHGAKQIVQITDSKDVEFIRGRREMNSIKVLESAKCDLAVLIDNDGKVVEIGHDTELMAKADEGGCGSRIPANGGVLMPGLVDAHSHPVFAGDRVHEFAMKLAGATYMEVQKAGGGILFTMEKTRAASEDELLRGFEHIAIEMLKSGTTTLEAKSGYGLDTESEMKMLGVIDMAADYLPLEVSGTFCGAHAVPKGSTEERQTNMIVEEMVPAIVAEKKDGRLTSIENIDVFCEKGNFEVESSKRILEAGKKAGLAVNFHAEELNQIGGAEMGAAIQANAMSHLEKISDEGIAAMVESGSVAVLLPTTAFMLRLQPPPARKMIDDGVIVALGSDFNPNAYCLAMPMVMHLACVQMHMSMSEALTACTINAAHALRRGKTHGAICEGRNADIIVVDAPRWEHLIYEFGCHNSIIKYVIKNGNLVYTKPA
ncbi:putative imidazolonepropionase [Toxocara canis]|uniref:Probable imidazolonepropionase n=1 Tax=Toxocara canis TaxID=6265 RepID=A0A0B2VLH7_TOXCA|nr:putative imidazolonepropionase [Toxocara canis]